jgi:hypothetical protein
MSSLDPDSHILVNLVKYDPNFVLIEPTAGHILVYLVNYNLNFCPSAHWSHFGLLGQLRINSILAPTGPVLEDSVNHYPIYRPHNKSWFYFGQLGHSWSQFFLPFHKLSVLAWGGFVVVKIVSFSIFSIYCVQNSHFLHGRDVSCFDQLYYGWRGPGQNRLFHHVQGIQGFDWRFYKIGI